MKSLFLLLTFTLALAFTATAQPVVKSGTYTASLSSATTTYVYPLLANGDTITFSQLGVNTSTITVDSTSGTGNGVATLQYCDVLANGSGNGHWSDIATATITLAPTATTRTVTNPFGSRRIRMKCTQTTTGGTTYTLRTCYENWPW